MADQTPFANTPAPPYYIVAFSSTRTSTSTGQDDGYTEMASLMADMAIKQPGCLGLESTTRDSSGFGITNSFWRDEASILAWKAVVDHEVAQKLGKQEWYLKYVVRVAKVERTYSFESTSGKGGPIHENDVTKKSML